MFQVINSSGFVHAAEVCGQMIAQEYAELAAAEAARDYLRRTTGNSFYVRKA